jgi:beta-glucuronidase
MIMLFPFLSRGEHQTQSLDGDWKFRLDSDSTGWQSWYRGLPDDARTVSVPHTWNIEDGNERYFGTAWYQKEVHIPEEWSRQQVRLHFEAVYRDAVIWVNGRKAGENKGSGYTPFSFDISRLVHYGANNRIVLSVSNAFSDSSFPYLTKFDWNNDGGIIRPVSLIVTGKPSIRYAHADPEIDFGKLTAKVAIRIKTWEKDVEKAVFRLTLSEYGTKRLIFSQTAELKMKNGIFTTDVALDSIKLWHFDSPHLYSLQVEVINRGKTSDTYNTRFGFRKVEIKGKQLFLNEEPVRLAGIEYMPGSHPEYGMAEPVKVMSTAVNQMKDLNCVITRFHWQQDRRMLDMLDECGMLVQEELPWWQNPDNLTPEMEMLAKQQIDAMIERDFNHPCIFSWGISNEVQANTDRDNYTRLIDHTRTWGGNTFVTIVSCIIADAFADDPALLADIPTWNDYVGSWHAKVNEDAPGILQNIHEKALNGRPLLVTEAGLCEPQNVGGDARRIVDMTYHYDLWAKNDFIFGCIYFCLNDYRTHFGESGKGRYQQRIHGLTDQWFGKKPSYAVYKSLAAPVYFEWLQPSAKGTEADVSIAVKNSLPAYTLRNYRLVWKNASGTIRELLLPDLKPGEKYKTVITGLSPNEKPFVQVVRPNGYIVSQY